MGYGEHGAYAETIDFDAVLASGLSIKELKGWWLNVDVLNERIALTERIASIDGAGCRTRVTSVQEAITPARRQWRAPSKSGYTRIEERSVI